MPFHFAALDPAPFGDLFALAPAALKARNAVLRTVPEGARWPCRVSLDFAKPGERVALVHHMHLEEASPYRAGHAIFVREGAEQVKLNPGELPPIVEGCDLSIRAFDSAAILVDRTLATAKTAAEQTEAFLARSEVAFVDLHYAAAGCFIARATSA